MTRFSIRIEMHDKTESSYLALHSKMSTHSYSRFTKGDDGLFYELPTAMYVGSFSVGVTAEQVRDHVLAIVHPIDNCAWVYVARYDQAAWSLKPAGFHRAVA